MMRISFAVLVFAALVMAGCLSGDDDDDDDGYECDFGQHDSPFGGLNSPAQECAMHRPANECMVADPEREIEWRCNCAPDSCQRWKDVYDYMGLDY